MFMKDVQVYNYDTRQGIFIMYLALNQDLAKSICDTMVLLFGTIYCLMSSSFFPKNWNML